MKKLAITLSILVISFKSQARAFTVEFINSQSNMCVVYLDSNFIGKINKGETFTTKLKKGTHTLSFVVFQPNGDYYTYVRDLEVNDEQKQFLLVANDSGYMHLEKYEGVNPLVLQSIQHLPVLSTDNNNLLHLKLENITFEMYRFEFLKAELTKYRFTTHDLLSLMDFVKTEEMKTEIAHMAYQHLLDKHNYHTILFHFNENSAKRLEKNAEIVNRYL